MMEHNMEKAQKQYGHQIETKYGVQLHHYTGFEKILKILNTHELWLFNTLTMNDWAETDNYFMLAEKLLRQKSSNISTSLDLLNRAASLKHTDPIYGMCFSQNEDEAGQWERYAENGGGVCISFNSNNLAQILFNSDFQLLKMNYNKDLSDYKDINILIEYVNTGELKTFARVSDLIFNIYHKAVLHKNYSFRLENEIRMLNISNKAITNYISYENINGVIKKVVKLQLDNLCDKAGIAFQDLVDKITIGPRCKQQINIFREYLDSKGLYKLAEKTEKSQCTLRP